MGCGRCSCSLLPCQLPWQSSDPHPSVRTGPKHNLQDHISQERLAKKEQDIPTRPTLNPLAETPPPLKHNLPAHIDNKQPIARPASALHPKLPIRSRRIILHPHPLTPRRNLHKHLHKIAVRHPKQLGHNPILFPLYFA